MGRTLFGKMERQRSDYSSDSLWTIRCGNFKLSLECYQQTILPLTWSVLPRFFHNSGAFSWQARRHAGTRTWQTRSEPSMSPFSLCMLGEFGGKIDQGLGDQDTETDVDQGQKVDKSPSHQVQITLDYSFDVISSATTTCVAIWQPTAPNSVTVHVRSCQDRGNEPTRCVVQGSHQSRARCLC